ncbi:MAG: hypothetical protein AB1Z98_19000 [Nannocystaceae bacterium]
MRSGLAMVATLLLGCPPLPSEVSDGTTTGSSATGSTDASGPGPGAATAATGDATGVGTGDGGSTHGEVTATSTGSTTTDGSRDDDTTAGVASAGSSSSGSPATCDELYGNAPGYVLCEETDTECRFNATTGGGTCNEVCADFGGMCLAAFDNPNDRGRECVVIEPNTDTCATERSTELCVCSR